MANVDVDALRRLVDEAITKWASGASPTDAAPSPANEHTEVKDDKQLPKDKRVVRTKSSGDRVYLIDETKKTRQWVTNPKILESLGFTLNDVVEIEDNEALNYQTGPALYRVADGHEPKA